MTPPRILGQAGGGLNDAAWAVNADVARIGQAGEARTAALLNKFAAPEDGVTVLHDLRIPIPNFTANIDHVVVSGSTVYIIDAKVWKPARYWTLGSQTRRGFERFTPAEKQTMAMATDALGRYLTQRGVRHTLARPVVAIWPSSTRVPLKVSWLRIPGAKAMSGDAFERYAAKEFTVRMFGGAKAADAGLVTALAPLLLSTPTPRRTGTR